MSDATSRVDTDSPSSDEFVRYYAEQSVSQKTMERVAAVKGTIERALRARGAWVSGLEVADIGCGAGTQCMLWARDGHHTHGLDINAELIALGNERARTAALRMDLRVGTATSLPWDSASMDVCIAPELLEHVPDWRQCLREFARILRPGGVAYMSTSNKLCPVQDEYDLPLYSWYPAALKRHYERLAVTTRPELVSHAQYPAVNWFTFHGLRQALREEGFEPVLDRFDLIDLSQQPRAIAALLRGARSVPPLRWVGQLVTPYTVALAFRAPSR